MSVTFTERYEGVIERDGWPEGEWDGEPDKVVWIDEATGLACQAKRGGGGAWCGYVGVPKAHPWHGLGYSEHLPSVPCDKDDGEEWSCYEDGHSPGYATDVHGSLTYAAACWGEDEPEKGICHIADEPVWWFGFDCSHSGDMRPESLKIDIKLGLGPRYGDSDVYRTLDYVVAETTRLAEQIARAS